LNNKVLVSRVETFHLHTLAAIVALIFRFSS